MSRTAVVERLRTEFATLLKKAAGQQNVLAHSMATTTAHRPQREQPTAARPGMLAARVSSRHRTSRTLRDLQVHQSGTQRLAVRVERQ